MFRAESFDAPRANPVGELESDTTPGNNAAHERITVIPTVPCASTNQHVRLLETAGIDPKPAVPAHDTTATCVPGYFVNPLEELRGLPHPRAYPRSPTWIKEFPAPKAREGLWALPAHHELRGRRCPIARDARDGRNLRRVVRRAPRRKTVHHVRHAAGDGLTVRSERLDRHGDVDRFGARLVRYRSGHFDVGRRRPGDRVRGAQYVRRLGGARQR